MSCPRRAVSALVVLRLFAISFAQQEIPRAHVVNLEDRPERREAFIRRVQDVVPSDVEFDYSFLRASNASDAQVRVQSPIILYSTLNSFLHSLINMYSPELTNNRRRPSTPEPCGSTPRGDPGLGGA